VRAREGGTALTGTVSHRPAPKPILTSPRLLTPSREPPPQLRNPDAIEFWQSEPVVALFEHGVITVADVPSLIAMCQHWGDLCQARRVLDEQGRYVHGSNGQMQVHPASRLADRASEQFLRYASEFGMTPTARTRVGLMDAARRNLSQDLSDRLGSNPRLVDEGETS